MRTIPRAMARVLAALAACTSSVAAVRGAAPAGGRAILVERSLAGAEAAAARAAAAAAGSIRGRVEVRRTIVLSERRPNPADLGGGRRLEAPDHGRSVVYLESGPRPAFDQREPARAVMDQRNETFVPHVLAIMAGTTVDFPNSDRIYHNVFSLSKPGPFDLGRYAAGRSKSVRFDRPGIIRVFCDIHSHMSAFILVFGHPYFTMTDGDGRYRLDNVPSGAYTIVAWNEGTTSEPAPVTVASGGTTEMDLLIR